MIDMAIGYQQLPHTHYPMGRIAVMGAGAVGCYYGFKLARAGHDVVLIGRPQHVEPVERQGLRLETQTFDEHIRVSASTEGSAVQGAQLVLFCVKSIDTESGAAAIKPHLAADAFVLSLQNGVENADRLRALLLPDVIATVALSKKRAVALLGDLTCSSPKRDPFSAVQRE
jgi:2-dehydropantoate 2-reductase